MFVITGCDKTYQILNDGIGDNKLLSKEELVIEASKFDNFSVFSVDDEIELVNPSSVGLNNAAANLSYDLYKIANDHIFEQMEKIAETLPEDLADFMHLIVRQAKSTTFIDVDPVAFKKEYKRALSAGVDNPKKVAIMSVLNVK